MLQRTMEQAQSIIMGDCSSKQQSTSTMEKQSTSTKKLFLSDIVQDKKLKKHILRLAENEDDPPVVFHWNYDGLSQFWNKAAS